MAKFVFPEEQQKSPIEAKKCEAFLVQAARLSLGILSLCLLVDGEACSTSSKGIAKERRFMSDERRKASVENVLEINREQLMSIPGVVGVGIAGNANSPSIVVMLRENKPELQRKLPRQLGGFPVRREITGDITAF